MQVNFSHYHKEMFCCLKMVKIVTSSLVNGFKRHIVMAAPFPVTMLSSVQNLMKSSSRRFDGMSRSLDDRD